jgi:hypothetical protein
MSRFLHVDDHNTLHDFFNLFQGVSLSGGAGKVLTVKQAEDGYELDTGGSVAPEVGDMVIVSNEDVTGGYLTSWDVQFAGPSRSFTVGTNGVTVVLAGVFAVTSHVTNDDVATANPYVAVLRSGVEIGPYYFMGVRIPSGVGGEVSATAVLEAGDVLTLSSNRLVGARMMVTRIA